MKETRFPGVLLSFLEQLSLRSPSHVTVRDIYILVHSSHKLQLLDVRCFSLLKRIYRTEIEKLIYTYIIYVSKEDFFSTFVIVFYIIITELNIRSGFRTTELVLHDLDYMIS
jgi:hypothetical protein